MRVIFAVIALAIGITPGFSEAQSTTVVAPGAWGGWGQSHHASTAEEGFARGMADLTRSAGMANLMNSEAAINVETARRQNIENRVYGTEAYFDMRRINRAARDAERGPRPTQDDLVRFARARAPSRLSVSELDPYSGQISWPPILRYEVYAEQRQSLDTLFAEWAMVGHLDIQQRSAARQATQQMQDMMRSRINDYAPQEYAQTRAFVQSLSAELSAPSS